MRDRVGKMRERERRERNYKEYKTAREREKFLDDVMRIDKICTASIGLFQSS